MGAGGWHMHRRALGVGLAYAGTVVGAGFASGREIWQFFSRHGPVGGIGILMAGTAFFFFGRAALERGRLGTSHFAAFLTAAYGRWGIVLHWLTTLLLATGVGVVSVGGGTALHLLTGWSRPASSLGMLAAVLLTALSGPRAIVRANTVVVPYIVALTLLISLWPLRVVAARPFNPQNWWLSAALYISYNLFTGMMVLFGLGRAQPSRRANTTAALLGAAILTGLALLEHRLLLTLGGGSELPMLEAAAKAGAILRTLFGVSLLAAMYTTGIGQAFALVARYGRRRAQALWLCAAMIPWPLQTLVAYVYPLLGVMSVAFWAPLILPGRTAGGR